LRENLGYRNRKADLRKLITLIKYDLKCLLKPGAVLILLAPVIVVFSVYLSLPEALFTGGMVEPFDVAIADNGGDIITDMIISEIRDLGIVNDLHTVTKETGLRLLEQAEVAVFVDLPVGMEHALTFNIPVEITIYGSYDFPIESAIMRTIATSAARGVSAVQADIFVFTYLAEDAFEFRPDFVDARMRLAMRLMLVSLGRNAAVQVEDAMASGHLVQLVAITLFVTSAFSAIYVSLNTAAQHRERSLASMKVMNTSFTVFAAAKCVESVLFALIAAGITLIAAGQVGIDVYSPTVLLFGAGLIAILMFPPCLLFSLAFKNPGQTALCGFGFLFCALFLGAVYPSFLVVDVIAALSRISPASFAVDISRWTFGGSLTAIALIPFVASSLFFIPSLRLWRVGIQ
jgi:ABC-type multidrug transport system fused ATPase/permease subunit